MTNEFAIKVLTELKGYGDKFANIGFDRKEALKTAIKVLEQTSWIPCSERLPEHPENNDYYTVTIQCEHNDDWDDYVTGFAEWTEHGWDIVSEYIGQIKVVAWMPLPEPYKAESEDKE